MFGNRLADLTAKETPVILYLVCDESGAKGYADSPEKYLGETGVFAGYLIPEALFDEVNFQLEQISQRFFGSRKPHIREISETNMRDLRSEVFAFIMGRKLPCLYEAIHVEGFHQSYTSVHQMHEGIRSIMNNNRRLCEEEKPRLLHEELFQGLFCKASAFLLDYCAPCADSLQILVDAVDASILRRFLGRANEMTDFAPKIIPVKVWDHGNKKQLHREIRINYGSEDSSIMRRLEEINWKIAQGPPHLVLAADVIANSLNHHFQTRPPQNVGKPLHTFSAVSGHSLAGMFYGLSHDDDEEGTWFTDQFFMHPLQQSRRKATSGATLDD